MGHIVNPISFRLGVNRTWNSTWSTFNFINYSYLIQRDLFIYNFLKMFFNKLCFVKYGFMYSHSKIINLTGNNFNIINYIYIQKLFNFNKSFLKNKKRLKLLNKFPVDSVASFEQPFSILFIMLWRYFQKDFFELMNVNISFKDLLIKKSFLEKRNKFDNIALSSLKNQWRKSITFESSFKLINKKVLFFKKSINKMFLKNYLLRHYFLKNNNKLSFKINYLRLVLSLQKKIQKFLYFFLLNILYFKPFFYFLKLTNLLIRNWLLMISDNCKTCEISYIFLKDNNITSQLISYYVTQKLRKGHNLGKILKPVFKNLNENPLILGYKIGCSGRFSRKQRATYLWENAGNFPLNKLNAVIDYSYRQVTLKFGACGIKIWLCKKNF
jgi:hypothetical protein